MKQLSVIILMLITLSGISCSGQQNKPKQPEKKWYVFFQVNVHPNPNSIEGYMYISNIIEVKELGANLKVVSHNAASQVIKEYFDNAKYGTFVFEYYNTDYLKVFDKRNKFLNEYPQSNIFELKDYPKLLNITTE